jgi:hypothetical protein
MHFFKVSHDTCRANPPIQGCAGQAKEAPRSYIVYVNPELRPNPQTSSMVRTEVFKPPPVWMLELYFVNWYKVTII